MKKIVTLSAAAFLSTSLYANSDMQAQIDALKAQLDALQKQYSKQITDLETKQATTEKAQKNITERVSEVNKLANNDNLKFDVDFRTAYDNLSYKTLSGQKLTNDALYSNRLWLGMGYDAGNDMVFKGQLAYHKSFGQAAFNPANGYPQRGVGFDTFDWISSEVLNDDKLRVREAYWLWTPTLGDRGYTFSVGRRPSTNGYIANLREDDKSPKSPLGHVINMEFDGASAGIKLDDIAPGMMFKLCLGRGLTNAKAWANEADSTLVSGMGATSPNYIDDSNALDNVDLYGFIFVPYDDGQYAVKTTWYRGLNVPGMVGNMTIDTTDANGAAFTTASGMGIQSQTWGMDNTGDMDGAAISFKVDGIGDEINDFLDDTTFFASFAMSKSHPEANLNSMNVALSAAAQDAIGAMPAANQAALNSMMGVLDTGAMMGSNDSEVGSSIWLGLNMPNLTGGRFGLEYNHGSKYWRPFTYGEDTMAGSKLATRGDAYEAYWTQPLIGDVFSMQIRYTYMKYDYTGSNGFFGAGGAAYSMEEAQTLNNLFSMMGAGFDPVEKAQDLRVYFRYRY
ncbi:MAG: DUF3373 family protein [Campylobacterales bacterium]|nr:DUF3373 family protein [Campylobacterales bacterium]